MKSKIFLFAVACTSCMHLEAQKLSMEDAVERMVEYCLEKSEVSTGVSWNEDMLIQHWVSLFKRPLDLNIADEKEIQTQLLLNPLQTYAFIQYRSGVTFLEDVHELQAISGWNLDWIRLIIPFVKLGGVKKAENEMNQTIKNGNHQLQFRANRIIQKKQGFQSDTSWKTPFGGSRWSREIRYGFAHGTKFKFGFQGESDAGERWMINKNQAGMDHMGFYVSIAPKNHVIKKLLLGDYTVSIGQGLMLWQSFGGYKGNDVLMIKNQQKGIESYRSIGEGVGFRGLGIEMAKGKESLIFFLSSKNSDAALVVDSFSNRSTYTPVETGLHRTFKEITTKNSLRSQTLGYALSHQEKNISFSFNHVFSTTNHTLNPSDALYKQFEKKSRWQNNIGFDFNAQFHGNHFFGEWIIDHNGSKGIWLGLLSALSKSISISSFYRKLDRGLLSVSANLPTEYGINNEEGLYLGINLNHKRMNINAYADIFRSKWLRYGIHSPSFGNEWVLCGSFKSEDKTELQIRVKQENKSESQTFWQGSGVKPWNLVRKTSFRLGITREISKRNSLRVKTELVQWKNQINPSPVESQFYLFEFKTLCIKNRCKMNFWICYTDIPDTDLALYVYEADPVVGAVQLTSLFKTGVRFGITLSFNMYKNLKINLKYISSIQQNTSYQGSGLDQIVGNKRSEFGLGFVWRH